MDGCGVFREPDDLLASIRISRSNPTDRKTKLEMRHETMIRMEKGGTEYWGRD